MPTTYPSAWLLLTVPFLSSLLVRNIPALLRLATRMNRLTRPVGLLGLTLLCAGVVGLLPMPWGLPLALIGGALSGYAVFTAGGDSDAGDDWRQPGEPPDEPPPPPGADDPIDWPGFDRLREEWEREPTLRR
ncbi:MAG: hypothetical protein ACJ764_06020 [Solirubrobacteraceae bacterium]